VRTPDCDSYTCATECCWPMMKPMSISPDRLLAAPALLWFEVMDKEPALAQRAALYGVLIVVGWLLSRKRWWLGLLVLPVVAVFAWADVGELHDPFVGPAIIREAGLLHVLVWYTFILAGIGVPVLTAAIMRRRKSL
jgi:hypothetical protein